MITESAGMLKIKRGKHGISIHRNCIPEVREFVQSGQKVIDIFGVKFTKDPTKPGWLHLKLYPSTITIHKDELLCYQRSVSDV